ncbi:hypothetical protein HanHA300_Chr06g0209581 [Helianthus annuus]|nr:hypothetical protein HanHA300_Chr06g0209581 [Helianthus annuus]KAJ0566547.1 hypothetical protein HanIR_Chr06g0274921 [Helianthus annuus]
MYLMTSCTASWHLSGEFRHFLPSLSRLSCTFFGSFMASNSDVALLTTAVTDCIPYVPTFMGLVTSFFADAILLWSLFYSTLSPVPFITSLIHRLLTELMIVLIKPVICSFSSISGSYPPPLFILHIRSANKALFTSN